MMDEDNALSSYCGLPILPADSPAIDIAAVGRLKHAALFRASEKFGSQSGLARYLGVSVHAVSAWVNLKKCPSDEILTPDVQRKLLEATGQHTCDLFPEELRAAVDFLRAPKKFAKVERVELEAIREYALTVGKRFKSLAAPSDQRAIIEDSNSKLLSIIDSNLRPRYATAIKLAFDLHGTGALTLREIGEALGVGTERARQIISQAIRRLREPCVKANILVDFDLADDVEEYQ